MKKNASIKLFSILFILLLIHSSNQKFLQYDTNKICPNPPPTSLGILISLSESDEYVCKSTLTQEEKESYEDIVVLKRSFSSTMSYIPQSFAPEDKEYWKGLNYLLIIFVIIAVFPAIFIIFYLFMRFVLKKCTGPKKISQVNKTYRNITWVIMLVSSIVTAILFALVLSKSVKVGKSIEKTFNYADDLISESDNAYTKINDANNFFKKNNLNVPDEKYMQSFGDKIGLYISNTKSRTKQILDDDSKRTKITGLVFGAYYILVILAFLFFFLRLEKLECVISIFLFFAIPGLIILEGYNAKFFFYYGDLCDSVNGALYANELPVAEQSLGYYYNCFPTDIKAILFNIRYRLFEKQKEYTNALIDECIKRKEENDDNNESDNNEVNINDCYAENDNNIISNKYKEINDETFTKLIKCQIVNKVIPKIESDFCKDSLNNMYSLLEIMTWLVLTSLGVALGSRRLQVLIWKKRNEIESMIQNQEILY